MWLSTKTKAGPVCINFDNVADFAPASSGQQTALAYRGDPTSQKGFFEVVVILTPFDQVQRLVGAINVVDGLLPALQS